MHLIHCFCKQNETGWQGESEGHKENSWARGALDEKSDEEER